MDFLGLFGRDNAEPSAIAYNVAYAEPERKIDLLLSGLQINTAFLSDAGGLPGDVRDLIAQGRKIEAIKCYRERTGLGLAEAKDVVEGNAAHVLSSIQRLEKKLDRVLKALNIEDKTASAYASEVATGIGSEVEQLVRQGNLIRAIKVYREQTGLGLKEAKDAVDAMAARLREK